MTELEKANHYYAQIIRARGEIDRLAKELRALGKPDKFAESLINPPKKRAKAGGRMKGE